MPAAQIPTSTSRGKETFFDGKVFDPENPTAYLKSLADQARRNRLNPSGRRRLRSPSGDLFQINWSEFAMNMPVLKTETTAVPFPTSAPAKVLALAPKKTPFMARSRAAPARR